MAPSAPPPGIVKAALNRSLSPPLTKAAAEKILGVYSASIKLDKENSEKGLSCANAGNKFKKEDTYTSTLLGEVKLPGSDEKLKLKPEAEEAIANIFAKTKDATTRVVEKFEAAIKDHNTKIKGGSTKPNDLKDELCRLERSLRNAMADIHKQEVAELEKLLNDDKNPLHTQFAKTKDPIIDALKKSQQEQLKAFSKQVDAELRRMHMLTNEAEARALLCALMEQNGRNRDYTDKLFQAMINRNNQQATVLLSNASEEGDRYAEADFKELLGTGFVTKTGKTITISAEPAGLSIKTGTFGGKLSAPDFLEMALLAKSMGWPTIRINIHHTDPDIARSWAAEAYLACIKAGYPADKFEINLEEEGKWKKQEPAQLGVDPKSVESLLSSDTRIPEDNSVAEYRNIIDEMKSNAAPVNAPAPAATVTGGADEPAATVTGGPKSS